MVETSVATCTRGLATLTRLIVAQAALRETAAREAESRTRAAAEARADADAKQREIEQRRAQEEAKLAFQAAERHRHAEEAVLWEEGFF